MSQTITLTDEQYREIYLIREEFAQIKAEYEAGEIDDEERGDQEDYLLNELANLIVNEVDIPPSGV